jgi:hypothetical protein
MVKKQRSAMKPEIGLDQGKHRVLGILYKLTDWLLEMLSLSVHVTHKIPTVSHWLE